MAVAYASHSSGGGATLAKPTGLAEGDLMIAILTSAIFGTGGTISAASGFTTYASVTTTSNDYIDMYVFYKRATSGDVAASTFNFGGGKGVLFRVTDGAANSGEIVGPFQPGTGDLPNITPAVADTLILFAAANSNNIGASDTLTSVTLTGGTNPTWTIDYNSAEAGHSLGMAHGTYASTTEITNISGDLSGSDDNITGYVLIRSTVSASGTTSLHVADADFFAPTATSDTNGTAALHTADADFFSTSGNVRQPAIWSNQSKNNSTWTPQDKP